MEAEASWNVVPSVLQGALSGQVSRALLGYSEGKDLPAMQEIRDPWVRKIPWRREWLPTPDARRIPWTEEPGGPWSTGSRRVRHD